MVVGGRYCGSVVEPLLSLEKVPVGSISGVRWREILESCYISWFTTWANTWEECLTTQELCPLIVTTAMQCLVHDGLWNLKVRLASKGVYGTCMATRMNENGEVERYTKGRRRASEGLG